MAILEMPFERLVTGVDVVELEKQAKELYKAWDKSIVPEEQKNAFWIDEEHVFHWITDRGQEKTADISEFAFSQLCQLCGVPAPYILKCLKSERVELAMENFKAWAGERKGGLLVRENDGAVRSIMSDSYTPFESYKVIKLLNSTVDSDKYELKQSFLSADGLHLRYISKEPLPYDDDKLFSGFIVNSSDVGKGSLSLNFFIYRLACTNGLLVEQQGGKMFSLPHNEGIDGKPLKTFIAAFNNMDVLTSKFSGLIGSARNISLKDYEMQMYIEKARRALRMSQKAVDKVNEKIDNTYGGSLWGLVNAFTEVAQDYTLDTRVEFEKYAGKMLLLAA